MWKEVKTHTRISVVVPETKILNTPGICYNIKNRPPLLYVLHKHVIPLFTVWNVTSAFRFLILVKNGLTKNKFSLVFNLFHYNCPILFMMYFKKKKLKVTEHSYKAN